MFGRNDFKLHQKVYFGRPNGEQTLGQIDKLNPTKAKVRTLEDRGNGRGASVGAVWNVPYGLLRPADPEAKPGEPAPPVPKPPLLYVPYNRIDNLILEAIGGVYCGLSPENLHCDGEASAEHVRQKRAEYARMLKGLLLALGRDVSEGEWYDWNESKRKYEVERKAAEWKAERATA